MSLKDRLKIPLHRGWVEIFVAAAALLISAVSLWVGIRNEKAQEDLVSASTWPFLYAESSNATLEGTQVIHMDVINSGVGPAKAETFEVFWNGKAWASADALVGTCCGYKAYHFFSEGKPKRTTMLTGGVQGTVIRAGETRAFLTLPLAADDADVWGKLDKARLKMSFRICYCSVFNQCWTSTFSGIVPKNGQLHPARVKKCPVPKVPFLQ